MQEDELVGVQWMPLEEYFAVPFTAGRPLFRQIHAACRAYADGRYRRAAALPPACTCGSVRGQPQHPLSLPPNAPNRRPPAPRWPLCRGLHGRKLETGFSARQDLLLFGEAVDQEGADKLSAEDTWIGLDTEDGAGAGAAAAGTAAAAAGGPRGGAPGGGAA